VVSVEVGVEGAVALAYQGAEEGILRLTEGEEAHVDCHVRGAYPPPAFTWQGPPTGEEGRVRKNVEEEGAERRRGILTVTQQVKYFT
jgi:hypothetical protein